MKVSSDSSFITYTDGINVVIKLNATSGGFLSSMQVGDIKISSLSTSDISPDSSNLIVGGTDATLTTL